MVQFSKIMRKLTIVMGLSIVMISSSGCTLTWGVIKQTYAYMLFWETLPIVPVPAYWSQKVEDAYYEEERYGKVAVLDPIEGENAPIFCLDPPTPDEVIRAVPNKPDGGFAFLSDTQWNNIRITVEPMLDRVGECQVLPLVGPVKKHECHYKCTVYYTKVERSTWPIPFEHKDEDSREVVYIDHDHLIRCAGPEVTH